MSTVTSTSDTNDGGAPVDGQEADAALGHVPTSSTSGIPMNAVASPVPVALTGEPTNEPPSDVVGETIGSNAPKQEQGSPTHVEEPKDSGVVGSTSVEAAAAGAAVAGAEGSGTGADSSQKDEEEGAIWEPGEFDVLNGRGASVNAHQGNKKFRALCFSRKPEFDSANHAAKRRIANEIVHTTKATWGSRFLKMRKDKGPWFEMTTEQAILKASQVMRDHKRADRLARREAAAALSGRKKNRATATPMDEIPVAPTPIEPLVENPFGVHAHDVLCGRGAYVNGHIGNQRLRTLAVERKPQFDNGNYTEKRTLATEIVMKIRSLDPPGRFLRRVKGAAAVAAAAASSATEGGIEAAATNVWEELADEQAIHKACQIMRDIDRADRKNREHRRQLRKLKKEGKLPPSATVADITSLPTPDAQGTGGSDGAMLVSGQSHPSANVASASDAQAAMDLLVGGAQQADAVTAGASSVEEAVAEAMDKALEAAHHGAVVKLDGIEHEQLV